MIEELLHNANLTSNEELDFRRKNVYCNLWRNLNFKESIIRQK